MKQHTSGDVVVSYENKVKVWGEVNNWEKPIKIFNSCGSSIEFLSENLLLRGGGQLGEGNLVFIDYAQAVCAVPPMLTQHDSSICNIQRITKNIVVTVCDQYIIVVDIVDTISSRSILMFEVRKLLHALAYFY